MTDGGGPSGPVELVIFDCDGVLVDTERVALPLEVELLGELGWELTVDEIAERFLGMSDADYVAAIEDHLGRAVPEGWLESTEPRYRAAFAADLRPVDGVESALDALERAGVATCVGSSGSHDKIRFTLGLTGLLDRFEGRIFSATEVPRGKPAPDLFLHAASSLGAPPARCVVVEDSLLGLDAALAAGMRAIAYDGGIVPAHRLARTGVPICSDMRRLAADLLTDPLARP